LLACSVVIRMGVPNGELAMPIPRTGYREVADDLDARIQSGEYPPGSKIPSYSELKAIYGVGVTAVQRAILVLRERGLVEGVAGRGVYVRESPSAGKDASDTA
jgi:GntR family transcriptional regulator